MRRWALLALAAAAGCARGEAPAAVRAGAPAPLESRSFRAGGGTVSDLWRLFDGPGGPGVIQIARLDGIAGAARLEPRYAGLRSELPLDAGGKPVSVPSFTAAEDDLRDAPAALPAAGPAAFGARALPGAARLPNPSGLRGTEPVGYVVISRRDSVELRPVRSAAELARWRDLAARQDALLAETLRARLSANLRAFGEAAEAELKKLRIELR